VGYGRDRYDRRARDSACCKLAWAEPVQANPNPRTKKRENILNT